MTAQQKLTKLRTKQSGESSLFDWSAEKEEAQKNAAIELVAENNADPVGQAEADALDNLAYLPREVSSDTILPDLSKYGFTDGRAMGPIMKRLVKSGAITPTGQFRKSQRPGSHRMPKAVYTNNC